MYEEGLTPVLVARLDNLVEDQIHCKCVGVIDTSLQSCCQPDDIVRKMRDVVYLQQAVSSPFQQRRAASGLH
jgi:hypothetical protein